MEEFACKIKNKKCNKNLPFKLITECYKLMNSKQKITKSKLVLPQHNTEVVCVLVKNIRPEYHDLREWMTDPNNIYIGRAGVVFIDGERFPKEASVWANPFTVKKHGDNAIPLYRKYITEMLVTNKISHMELESLKGKKLGCWCKSNGDEPCHGDVLLDLIERCL